MFINGRYSGQSISDGSKLAVMMPILTLIYVVIA